MKAWGYAAWGYEGMGVQRLRSMKAGSMKAGSMKAWGYEGSGLWHGSMKAWEYEVWCDDGDTILLPTLPPTPILTSQPHPYHHHTPSHTER